MASISPPPSILILFATIFLFLFSEIQSKPSIPSTQFNILSILEKAGEHTTFLNLLETTNVAHEIREALDAGTGATVFAPTDEAFKEFRNYIPNLNRLEPQWPLKLARFHVVSNYNDFSSLTKGSNPYCTMATSEDYGGFLLDFFLYNDTKQLVVSTDIVHSRINNVSILEYYPLSVFRIDEVFVSSDLFRRMPRKVYSAAPSPGVSSQDVPPAVDGLYYSAAASPADDGVIYSAAASPADVYISDMAVDEFHESESTEKMDMKPTSLVTRIFSFFRNML